MGDKFSTAILNLRLFQIIGFNREALFPNEQSLFQTLHKTVTQVCCKRKSSTSPSFHNALSGCWLEGRVCVERNESVPSPVHRNRESYWLGKLYSGLSLVQPRLAGCLRVLGHALEMTGSRTNIKLGLPCCKRNTQFVPCCSKNPVLYDLNS